MARIERSVEIWAPPEKLWHAAFWDRVPEYWSGIKRAEYTSGKPGLGAVAHMWTELAGQKDEGDAVTIEWVEYRKHTWKTTSGHMGAVGALTLDPIEGGTRATFVVDYKLPYSVFGKLMDKLRVSKEMNLMVEQAMAKLKEVGEK
jgi:hypothetical protein